MSTCIRCGKEITNRNTFFCSRDCYSAYKSENGTGVVLDKDKNGFGLGSDAICPICKKEFKRSAIANQIFCSKECVNKNHKMKLINKENHPRWKGGKKEFTCSYCGKLFYAQPSRQKNKKNMFCSRSCQGKWSSENRTGEKSSNWRGGSIRRVCIVCGKEFEVHRYVDKQGKFGKCCSNECRYKLKSVQMAGKGNPQYIDGSSKEPYCILFNNEFKRRVRDFFGNKCLLCGKSQNDLDYKLHVHHVDYDKGSCCNEESPRMFASLCRSCHVKTNNDRDKWSKILYDMIQNEYNGKCYYTKDEYYAVGSNIG